MIPDNQQVIIFSILECIIEAHCETSLLTSVLKKIYGAMEINQSDKVPDLSYTIKLNTLDSNQIIISRQGSFNLVHVDIDEFIFLFENDMTIKL